MSNQEIHNNNDHDKLIRLESTVEHLSKDIAGLTEIVDKHIEQDRETFRQIFEEMSRSGKQLSELTRDVRAICKTVEANSESVKDLTKKQTYALGFIAGFIAIGGGVWTVFKLIIPFLVG